MPYAFTAEDFAKFSEDIINAEGDQATITTLLADMRDTYTANIGVLADANKNLETTKSENERLLKANMNLYLRIGADPKEKPAQPQEEEKPMDCEQYMEEYFKKLEGK